jgi:hypothetical protein
MGSFYTSIHVRSEARDDVAKALEQCGVLPAYLSLNSTAGWISIFPKSTESQDQNLIKQLSTAISTKLQTATFGMLVHDSDIFWYVLCENGKAIDVYDSDPGYFDGLEKAPSGGNVSHLSKYCLPDTSALELRKILHSTEDSTFAGDSLAQQIGSRLGLPEEFYSNGYNYLNEAAEEQDEPLNVELLEAKTSRPERKSNVISLVPRSKKQQTDVPDSDATSNHGEASDEASDETSEEASDESTNRRAPERLSLERSSAGPGFTKLGGFSVQVKESWKGTVHQTSLGSSTKGWALHAVRAGERSELLLTVHTPKKPQKSFEQFLESQANENLFEQPDSERPVITQMLQNGLRLRVARWRGNDEHGQVYGLLATADVNTDEAVWFTATASTAELMKDIEEMLGSLKRS